MRRPILCLALAIQLVFLAVESPAQDELEREKKKIKIEWKQHKTKHYVIEYEAVIPESTVKIVAKELEDILIQYMSIFRQKPGGIFKVKFLDSLNTYEQEGGDPSHPGMYIDRGADKFLLIRQMPFYQLTPLVYHEAMHQYLADWLGEGITIPTWFTEGMAMFYEGMEREEAGKKQLNPRKINTGKIRMVKDAIITRQHIPLEKLIDATHEEFHNKDKESLYYGESFSIVYFFVKAKGPKSVLAYMKELKKTGDAEAAAVKLFGKKRKKLAKIEKAWKKFVLSHD